MYRLLTAARIARLGYPLREAWRISRPTTPPVGDVF